MQRRSLQLQSASPMSFPALQKISNGFETREVNSTVPEDPRIDTLHARQILAGNQQTFVVKSPQRDWRNQLREAMAVPVQPSSRLNSEQSSRPALAEPVAQIVDPDESLSLDEETSQNGDQVPALLDEALVQHRERAPTVDEIARSSDQSLTLSNTSQPSQVLQMSPALVRQSSQRHRSDEQIVCKSVGNQLVERIIREMSEMRDQVQELQKSNTKMQRQLEQQQVAAMQEITVEQSSSFSSSESDKELSSAKNVTELLKPEKKQVCRHKSNFSFGLAEESKSLDESKLSSSFNSQKIESCENGSSCSFCDEESKSAPDLMVDECESDKVDSKRQPKEDFSDLDFYKQFELQTAQALEKDLTNQYLTETTSKVPSVKKQKRTSIAEQFSSDGPLDLSNLSKKRHSLQGNDHELDNIGAQSRAPQKESFFKLPTVTMMKNQSQPSGTKTLPSVEDADDQSIHTIDKTHDESEWGKTTKSVADHKTVLENFLPAPSFTAEGLVAVNDLAEQTIEYCVKVGVDPKTFAGLFPEADQLNQQPSLSKQKTFADAVNEHQLAIKLLERSKTKRQSSTSGFSLPNSNEDEKSTTTAKMFKKLVRKKTHQFDHRDLTRQLKWTTIQIMILTKRLQTLNDLDGKRINQMNLLLAHIQKQDSKIQNLEKFRRTNQDTIHFAFMFACPLALSFEVKNRTKLQMIAQLDHKKEFAIIKQKLAQSKAKIAITSQQCTIESLQEVLRKKPLGIHFSGHGIENNYESLGDVHYQYKNEGDFLLLETLQGDSKLVSRNKLRRLINEFKCKLEFVVVATCHSEFVGRIFLDAGAKHVVCIKKQDEIIDEAVMHFTSTFYSAVFSQKEKICDAFRQAQLSVKLNHSEEEASVFQLLVHNAKFDEKASTSSSLTEKVKHGCDVFGDGLMGNYILKEPFQVTFTPQLPRSADLVGRQQDMYALVSKIMAFNNHLITLIGLPGVGKSALVKSTLLYIQDRYLLRGGIIYFDARSCSTWELFIRKLGTQLIRENERFFGTSKSVCNNKQLCLQRFTLILGQIGFVKEDILLVIDNCEEVIERDRQNFKILVSIILAKIPSIKILLTTRIRLASGINEANEEIIVLNGLNNLQTEALLKRKLSRQISIAEENELLKLEPDYSKYPQEKGWKPRKLHEHHLFRLLGGNPQSVILVTPLLDDPMKNMKLVDLYKTLTSNQLCEMLKLERIEDSIMASLRLSVHVSVKMIKDSDPVSLQLFLLLGLLPGGVKKAELKEIWAFFIKHTKQSSEYASLQTLLSADQSESSSEDSWQQAELKLRLNKLIYEVSEDDPDRHGGKQENQQAEDEETKQPNLSSQVRIQMPQFVRNFSEAMIAQNEAETFQEILTEHFLHKLTRHYFENNAAQTSQSQLRCIIEDLNSNEQNINAFINRVKEIFGKSQTGLAVSDSPLMPRQKVKTFCEGVNKQMTRIKTFKSFSLEQELVEAFLTPVRKESSTEIKSKEQTTTPSRKVSDCLLQAHCLLDSYNQILLENKRNDVVNQFIARLQRASNIRPVRGSLPMSEWAKLMWKWCFKIYQKKQEQKKNAQVFIRSATFLHLDNQLEHAETNEVRSEEALKAIEASNKHNFSTIVRPAPIARRQSNRALVTYETQTETTDQEKVLLFYFANLTLLQQFPLVITHCEELLFNMERASMLFKANIYKCFAFALLQIVIRKNSKDEYMKNKLIKRLEAANELFRKTQSLWGQGVSKFLEGLTHDYFSAEGKSLQCYRVALDCFTQISHYSGCIQSAQKIIEKLTASLEQNTDEKDFVEMEIMELETQRNKDQTALLMVQRSFQQTMYIKRTMGEQFGLLADVVTQLHQPEFKKLMTQLYDIPKPERKRMSQAIQQEQQDRPRLKSSRTQFPKAQPTTGVQNNQYLPAQSMNLEDMMKEIGEEMLSSESFDDSDD